MATIYVCRKCKHSKGLQKALRQGTDATVKLIGCQDVCKEPVAGTRTDGCLQWFGGLDSRKRQRALIDLVNGETDGEIPGPLAKVQLRKKAGQGPR